MIVDDEDVAVSHLRSYIAQTPFLHLLSSHNSAIGALKDIENKDLQLVFLDINMPGLNGIELARIIKNREDALIHIIFTTGFERFALEGYKVNALDYLIKPISYEEFITAAFKAKISIEKNSPGATARYNENDFIFLRVEYELVKAYLKNILYFEGSKDYVKVYTENPHSCIRSLTTMKDLENKLPLNSFMRIHRSFIVSLDKINTISKGSVRIGSTFIPISGQYRESFKKFTDQWF